MSALEGAGATFAVVGGFDRRTRCTSWDLERMRSEFLDQYEKVERFPAATQAADP